MGIYERLLLSAAALVGTDDWDLLHDEEQRRARLWAEANVYAWRTTVYAGMRITGEVETPSHKDVQRYQTAAVNAASRRLEQFLSETG